MYELIRIRTELDAKYGSTINTTKYGIQVICQVYGRGIICHNIVLIYEKSLETCFLELNFTPQQP